MDDITTVIVTRNRAKDLSECLQSLVNQASLPDRVLVINNNSKDNTTSIINKFKKKLNIKEVPEMKPGYAYARNKGLTETRTKWIVFIDDDCIARRDWYEQIIKTLRKNKNKERIASVLGKSENYYYKNIFACAFQYGIELWREEYLNHKGDITSYEILDSRNIIYNKRLLDKYNIGFDTNLAFGGEDSDLGLQIQANQLVAINNPEIIVQHKEPNTLEKFLSKRKTYRKAKDQLRKQQKYQTVRKNKVTSNDKLEIFRHETSNLNWIQKILVVALIKLS